MPEARAVTGRRVRHAAAAAAVAAALTAALPAAGQSMGLDCPGPGCPLGPSLANQDDIETRIRNQLEALANSDRSMDRTIDLGEARVRGVTIDREGAGLSPEAAQPQDTILGDVSPDERILLEVGFASGSAEVRHEPGALDPICRVLREQAGRRFAVVGHTDASGDAGYNERLSQRRAESVAELLTARCGLTEDRLVPVGLGERQPLSEVSPTSPQQRRVELQVLG